ncbi:MAG: division/cell wall cluster transcriptional repressor MraZ [Chloroflexota bacterium]
MFLGQYEYRVDEKGRVPLPPKYRPDFGEGVVLSRSVDRCITVHTTSHWQKQAEGMVEKGVARSKIRKLNRWLFGDSFSLGLDRQGRFPLPPSLRDYAEISDAAVIVGANTYLEIWKPDLWQKARDEARQEAWQNIESLEAE